MNYQPNYLNPRVTGTTSLGSPLNMATTSANFVRRILSFTSRETDSIFNYHYGEGINVNSSLVNAKLTAAAPPPHGLTTVGVG